MYVHCGFTLHWSVQSLPLLSLTSLPSTTHFQHLSIHILIFSTFMSYVMLYYWCSIILFYFHSSPKFQGSSLLQTCSTSEFVYDHACFCAYVYPLDLSFHEGEKTCGLCVCEPGLLFITWCPPNASIYPQTTCHYSLWLSNSSLCMYTTFSQSINQL
jgi:hypothetical protein